jgi:hypothetical protein
LRYRLTDGQLQVLRLWHTVDPRIG